MSPTAARVVAFARSAFTTNLSSKATALVLAGALYYYMYSQLSATETVTLYADRQTVAEGSTLLFEEPPDAFVVFQTEAITVELHGPKALVRPYTEGRTIVGTIARDKIAFHVPRADERPHQVTFDASDIDFDVEKELEVSIADPGGIRVLVDRRAAWHVQVRCPILAAPDIAREYDVKPEGTCDPPMIEVIGPLSEKGAQASLELQPFTVGLATQIRWTVGEQQVRAKLRERGLDSKSLQPVTVRATVTPLPVERRVRLPFSLLVPSHVVAETDSEGVSFLVPASGVDGAAAGQGLRTIFASGLGLKITVNGRLVDDDPDRVSVELRGPEKSLDAARLQASGTRVYIDIGDFLRQKIKFTKVPLQASNLPEGVTLGSNEAEVSIE